MHSVGRSKGTRRAPRHPGLFLPKLPTRVQNSKEACLPSAANPKLQKIQTEILKEIRGKLTTSALSTKLSYGFNQVARWEKGERRLLWTDFVSVCNVRKLPLAEQIEAYLGYREDLHDTGAFIRNLLSGKSIDEASRATGLSRSKISRWLHGKAPPTFIDVYLLLSSVVNVLSFLEPLVNLKNVASLSEQYNLFRHQRELTFSMPQLDALMEALLVRPYQEAAKHDAETLSAISGLSPEFVTSSLAALEKAGMVEKKAGKYRAVEIGIDYRADKQRMRGIILHWLEQASRLVEHYNSSHSAGALVGFSVFSLSAEGHEKVTALFREFNRAIHAIGSEDQGPKEKVFMVVNALSDVGYFRDLPPRKKPGV